MKMKTSITIYPAVSPSPHLTLSPQHREARHACAKRLGAARAGIDEGRDIFSGALDQAVLAGALNQLMRYTVTGCSRSAMCAAYLLERLATNRGTSAEMRAMCCRVCAVLEEETNNREIEHG